LLPIEWMDVFGTLGFVNLCLNPVIYAARYEMFRKSFRKILRKENNAASAMPTATI